MSFELPNGTRGSPSSGDRALGLPGPHRHPDRPAGLPRLYRLHRIGSTDRCVGCQHGLPYAGHRQRLDLRGDQLRRQHRRGPGRQLRPDRLPAPGRGRRHDLVSSDGVRLAGWYIPAGSGMGPDGPTVILAHANEGNKSTHARPRRAAARRLQPGPVRLPQPRAERRRCDHPGFPGAERPGGGGRVARPAEGTGAHRVARASPWVAPRRWPSRSPTSGSPP